MSLVTTHCLCTYSEEYRRYTILVTEWYEYTSFACSGILFHEGVALACSGVEEELLVGEEMEGGAEGGDVGEGE